MPQLLWPWYRLPKGHRSRKQLVGRLGCALLAMLQDSTDFPCSHRIGEFQIFEPKPVHFEPVGLMGGHRGQPCIFRGQPRIPRGADPLGVPVMDLSPREISKRAALADANQTTTTMIEPLKLTLPKSTIEYGMCATISQSSRRRQTTFCACGQYRSASTCRVRRDDDQGLIEPVEGEANAARAD